LSFANGNAKFSRENSKLQMIETAHVNKRKQVSTNQHPIGDDVSSYNRCAAARFFGEPDTTASTTGAQSANRERILKRHNRKYAGAAYGAAKAAPS
jgi:hypothetical protein